MYTTDAAGINNIHVLFVLTVTKEKLVQDILNKGDRGKHLNCLIKLVERKKIAIFREIVCSLLHILEEDQPVKFTPEDLRYLHQEIIEGHEEGNSSPLVFMVQKFGSGYENCSTLIGSAVRTPSTYMYTVDCQHMT